MRPMYKVLAPILLLILLATPCLGAERKIFKTKLDSGLTVILEEDHSAPVTSFQMWVRVGSADEDDKEAGIAHVFEHMLFKGTATRGVGEIAAEVEAAGGNINAFTSYDNTVYLLSLPSRHFSTGLNILADAIQNSSFDPAELAKELEVVLEEQRMGEDSPGRVLYKELLAEAFSTHNYRRPVIGFSDTIGSLTRQYIIDFFKRWYVPANMTLVVAGDFDTEKALVEIKETFKDFAPAPDPHTPRAVEPEQRASRATVTRYQTAETHMGMAFHIPELKHKDTYALDVLSNVLGSGATSRLYKKLKDEKAIVDSISTYAMTPRDPGAFFINVSLSSEDLKDVIDEIFLVIARLGNEGPTSRELEKARVNLESDFIYQRETMSGKARQLGYFETISGDIEFERKYLDGVRGVTAGRVKEVLTKYLIADNMTISILVPDEDGLELSVEGLIELVRDAEAEAISTRTAAAVESDEVTKYLLDSGITLLVKEDHSNETVAIYAAFPGGVRFESPETNGLGNFVAGMVGRGTAKRSREELLEELSAMAGGAGGFSGRNTTGISATFLSKHFDKGIEIFADMVENPTFPEIEIEKLRKDIISSIKRQKDYLPGYTFKLLQKELYRTHPYGMHISGEIETVSAFTRDDLRAHYERLFVPEFMILAVVGDVSAAHVVTRITELLGDFERDAQPLVEPAPEPTLSSIRAVGETVDKAQTNMGMGFLGTTITSEDRFAVGVLSEVLGSHGGRLFMELRDRLSLAYSVSAFSRPGVEPGLFGFYIGSAPEKKTASMEGILKELERIRSEQVTAEELDKAKNSIIGGYEMGLQSVGSQASNMANNELFGLGYDFYLRYPSMVEAVTAEDVLEAARKYLTLDAYTISIVGPASD